jgi:hypothetical protein
MAAPARQIVLASGNLYTNTHSQVIEEVCKELDKTICLFGNIGTKISSDYYYNARLRVENSKIWSIVSTERHFEHGFARI